MDLFSALAALMDAHVVTLSVDLSNGCAGLTDAEIAALAAAVVPVPAAPGDRGRAQYVFTATVQAEILSGVARLLRTPDGQAIIRRALMDDDLEATPPPVDRPATPDAAPVPR